MRGNVVKRFHMQMRGSGRVFKNLHWNDKFGRIQSMFIVYLLLLYFVYSLMQSGTICAAFIV
jgi:hypothetical protein